MVRHIYPSQAIPPEIHDVTSLEHPNLKGLYAAWSAIKGDRRFPAQPTEILRHVKPLISSLHLTEVVEDGTDFRFRLVGESVFPGLKDHQVGKLISEHPDDGVRLRFTMLLKATYSARRPIRGISNRKTGEERFDYQIESVWLPFSRDDTVQQILAMSVFEPAIGTR